MVDKHAHQQNFIKVIDRAIESCETAEFQPSDHFIEVIKLIQAGNGATREVKDYMLTRYACYLIAPHKIISNKCKKLVDKLKYSIIIGFRA